MTPDYEHMRTVINKDAFVTGLCRTADSELAALVGCKVGDCVGCAVFSLAMDATDDPEGLKRRPIKAYDIVARAYGPGVSIPLWVTNGEFADRADRLDALNCVIDGFKVGIFRPILSLKALALRRAALQK